MEALEKNYQGALNDKQMCVLSLQATEKDLIKIRSTLCELEVKHNTALDQSKKDLEAIEQRHSFEVGELKKALHVSKMDWEEERAKIQSQSDKLVQHEKELMVAQEQLRKKELEVASQVQHVKIETENKYRVINKTVESIFLSDPLYYLFIYLLGYA